MTLIPKPPSANRHYRHTQRSLSALQATGTAEEDMIAEIMAVITVVQQARKTGDPLPAVLPAPLFTRAIKFTRDHIEGRMHGGGLYHQKDIGDGSYRRFTVILNAYVQMLAALDELELVLKRVVGETST